MKCDELKVYTECDDYVAYDDYLQQAYEKSEVDAAIAELKEEIYNQKWRGDEWARAANDKDKQIDELKAMVTTDNSAVIANLEDELRKTQRALWLARANRAHAEWGHWATIWFCNTSAVLNINKSSVSQDPYRCTIQRNAAIWRNMWNEVERKCRAKAKEYK